MTRQHPKIDLKQTHKAFFTASSTDFQRVALPAANYLMIDGAGVPGADSPAYANGLEALYATAYTLKFASKTLLGRDYVVAPLEGLWWADDMSAFTSGNKADWKWTLMIMQPEWIDESAVSDAIEVVAAKKNPASLRSVYFEELDEGNCLQILHIGTYDDEAPTLARLHDTIMPEQGLTFNGKHHEVYLSDPRRTDPAKLKTILRQPVRGI